MMREKNRPGGRDPGRMLRRTSARLRTAMTMTGGKTGARAALIMCVAALPVSCWQSMPSLSSFTSNHRRLPAITPLHAKSWEEHVCIPTAESAAPWQKGRQRLMIHWKGEAVEDYSLQFRRLEFGGAVNSILNTTGAADNIRFTNALECTSVGEMNEREVKLYNEALQHIEFDPDLISADVLIKAVERCSLVHAIYHVVAEGPEISHLVNGAISSGGFDDMMAGGIHENDTWCFRVRYFGDDPETERGARYGNKKTRSFMREQKTLLAMKPLLIDFRWAVDLKKPDWKVMVLDGLGQGNNMVLARKLANGPKTSIMNPNTRVCITNTPLNPVAAFSMCNVAELREGQTVLDPYAGSCATLLAAALIEPSVRSVAVEIAHNGIVNRKDIARDYELRGLPPPVALIEGDANDEKVRDAALEAIGKEGFDAIIADPPYGIRESLASNPLVDLFSMVSIDRNRGQRLLKLGGRLVAFVPCTSDEDVNSSLPNGAQMEQAGLRLDVMREQRLNENLSRWLVAYTCVK